MTSNQIDRMINAIVAPLSTQLEALIQSVRELNEMSFIRPTERNTKSDREESSGQHFDSQKDLTFVKYCVEKFLKLNFFWLF